MCEQRQTVSTSRCCSWRSQPQVYSILYSSATLLARIQSPHVVHFVNFNFNFSWPRCRCCRYPATLPCAGGSSMLRTGPFTAGVSCLAPHCLCYLNMQRHTSAPCALLCTPVHMRITCISSGMPMSCQIVRYRCRSGRRRRREGRAPGCLALPALSASHPDTNRVLMTRNTPNPEAAPSAEAAAAVQLSAPKVHVKTEPYWSAHAPHPNIQINPNPHSRPFPVPALCARPPK